MLVATIEVWPYGVEEAKYQTSRLFIANVEDLGFGQCRYRAHLRRDNDVPMIFTEDNSVEFTHSRKDGDTVCVQKAIAALEEEDGTTYPCGADCQGSCSEETGCYLA